MKTLFIALFIILFPISSFTQDQNLINLVDHLKHSGEEYCINDIIVVPDTTAKITTIIINRKMFDLIPIVNAYGKKDTLSIKLDRVTKGDIITYSENSSDYDYITVSVAVYIWPSRWTYDTL